MRDMFELRNELSLYPDYSAEIKELEKNGLDEEIGIDTKLLYRIINKHKYNAVRSKKLYDRYEVKEGGVPIFDRRPRFQGNEINNTINNDFFGEIIDFKVGYFAGKPIAYSYSKTDESEKDTGGKKEVEAASKALTDFVVYSNMYDVDMEITKFAAICGYAGRLFYVDPDGRERCMLVKPFECIVLSNTDVTDPQYAVRYYKTRDINDKTVWEVEFYDNQYIYCYEGNLGNLTFQERKTHMFAYCPLQIIPNNKEMMGDAEKVLKLIDCYDKDLSDCDNDIESFARAYMVFENVSSNEKAITDAEASGVIQFFSGSANGKVYYLTKDINDTFTESHIERVEKNIYRFSKTPNLNDEQFNSASGISLKFKLTGLETKCGMFQAKMRAAGTYMFKLLGECWERHLKIKFDPLQCIMDFKRNFPLDTLSEAQAAQALINAGLPQAVAYSLTLSGIDDISWVMKMIDEEQNSIPPLFDNENSGGYDTGLESGKNGSEENNI